MPSALVNQVHTDPNHFVDYGMSMQLSEPVSFDTNNFVAYDNVAPVNDMSSFEFTAYMGN
jgi:hypothetical protein